MTPSNHLRVLLVEDNPDHAAMILRHVERPSGGKLQAKHATSLSEGLEAVGSGHWDAVLLDLQLPDSRGLDTLKRMLDRAQELPVIVLTSLGDEELATGALQQGAQDYLVKDDFSSELLTRAVRYAIERKRIEEKLRSSLATVTEHAAELEGLNRTLQEKNRDLDEFSHMISHDLQEPVRHLMVFSQRLHERVDSQLPAEASFDLERIHAAAQRMESSIEGLQVLSHADRQKMHRRCVPLESCVNSSLAILEQSITDNGATVSFDPLPEVVADPALLALLFQNLISNALKYRTGEPAIRITAQRQADEWIFGVRDNGIGIDARHAKRIFVAFQRLHAREEYGGGSGLGLTICRKVVERHGGRIWVESVPGQGAHFLFTLDESSVPSLSDTVPAPSNASPRSSLTS